MAQDDIQGQVVDPSGNPVSGAIVELTRSFESNPVEKQTVLRTTTDSNGNYIFEFHPDGDGTTQDYHVSCYNHDGTAYVNSFNNPGVTADLPSNVIPDSGISQWEFEQDLTDSWGNLDLTDSTSAGYTTNAQQGSYAKLFDGTDDRATNPTESWLPSGSAWSIGVWFDPDTLGSDDRIIDYRGGVYHILNIGRSATDTLGFYDGVDHAIGTISTGDNYVGIGYDGNGSYECYLNTGGPPTTTVSSTPGSASGGLSVGSSDGDDPYDGAISQINSYDKLLSSSEWDSLYSSGSI